MELEQRAQTQGNEFWLKIFLMTGGSSSFSLPPVKLRAISRSFLCIRTMPALPAVLVRRRPGSVLRVVRDHDGQQLACVYFEDEPGRRSAAKLLTKDETRQIVSNLLTTVQLWLTDAALYRVTGRAAVRCVPSSTNGTFCRARSFPLEPSSRAAWPMGHEITMGCQNPPQRGEIV